MIHCFPILSPVNVEPGHGGADEVSEQEQDREGNPRGEEQQDEVRGAGEIFCCN